MDSLYKDKLDNRRWSFSSVNCYNTCPKAFYLTYLKEQPKQDNAFAQWGTFGHSLLERYYRGALELWDLGEKYREEYDTEVTEEFPYHMADSYYHSGEEYFDNFQGDFEGCQILGVEQYVELDIRGYTYIGYIDLLVKDDKGYIICDHKSKAGFKTEEEKHDYLRQLYLYSLYVKEQYDEYPYKLIFNMFRKGIWVEEPFQESALQEAVDWFVGNIQKIYQDEKFKDRIAIDYKSKGKLLKDFTQNDFYCNYICSVPCRRSIRYDDGGQSEYWAKYWQRKRGE